MMVLYAVALGLGFALLILGVRAISSAGVGRVRTWFDGLPAFITMQGVFMIFAVVCGAALAYWAYNNPMGTTDVGSWGHKHWLFVLVVWGLGHMLVVLQSGRLGSAGAVLHQLFLITAILLFIIFPFIGWVNSPSPPPPSNSGTGTRSEIPLVSMPKSMWAKLVIPAGGRSELIQSPSGMRHFDVFGANYRLHAVYADGQECVAFGKSTCPDGAVIGGYVTNEAAGINTVLYAFVPH